VKKLATMCREEYPNAAPVIDSIMFMDDFIARFENGNGAISIYYELSALMKPSNSQWLNGLPAAKN